MRPAARKGRPDARQDEAAPCQCGPGTHQAEAAARVADDDARRAEAAAYRAGVVAARRAARLMRWYPARWRERYEAEFAELLIADLAERPRSWRRAADIAAAGFRARLASAGLTRHAPGPAADPRAALATTAVCAGTCAIVGLAEASQLGISVQWMGLAPWATASSRPVLGLAMALMSAALLGLAAIAVTAALPLGVAVVRAWRLGRGRELGRPVLLIALAAVILTVGGRHFGNGWPGTGSDSWFGHGTAGPAAFGWAITMWFNSYWAHPNMLEGIPGGTIGWQLLSLAALASLLGGAWSLLRCLPAGPRATRFGMALSWLAGGCLAVLAAGMACWASVAPTAPIGPVHVGSTNLAGMAAIRPALTAGVTAFRQVSRAGKALRACPAAEPEP